MKKRWIAVVLVLLMVILAVLGDKACSRQEDDLEVETSEEYKPTEIKFEEAYDAADTDDEFDENTSDLNTTDINTFNDGVSESNASDDNTSSDNLPDGKYYDDEDDTDHIEQTIEFG